MLFLCGSVYSFRDLSLRLILSFLLVSLWPCSWSLTLSLSKTRVFLDWINLSFSPAKVGTLAIVVGCAASPSTSSSERLLSLIFCNAKLYSFNELSLETDLLDFSFFCIISSLVSFKDFEEASDDFLFRSDLWFLSSWSFCSSKIWLFSNSEPFSGIRAKLLPLALCFFSCSCSCFAA